MESKQVTNEGKLMNKQIAMIVLFFSCMSCDVYSMEQGEPDPDTPLVKRVAERDDYDQPVAAALTESMISADQSAYDNDDADEEESDELPDYGAIPLQALSPKRGAQATRDSLFDAGDRKGDTRIVLVDQDGPAEQFTQLILADRDDTEKTDAIIILATPRLGILKTSLGPKGNTAMHVAASMNHKHTLATLVGLNGQLGIKNDDQYTPLMIAASRGYVQLTRMLLEYRLVGKAWSKVLGARGMSDALRGAADLVDATSQWASNDAIQNTADARRLAFHNGHTAICNVFQECGYSVRAVLTDEDIAMACEKMGALKTLKRAERQKSDHSEAKEDEIVRLPTARPSHTED